MSVRSLSDDMAPAMIDGARTGAPIWLRWALFMIVAMISLGVLMIPQEASQTQASSRLSDGLADLAIASIASAQSPSGCPSLPAGILVTVRNEGDVPATGFDTTLDGGVTSCGPWRLELLATGEEYTFCCPAGISGARVFTATVDLGDDVAESDEGNNQRIETVLVVTLPTCTPTATPISTPTAVPTGWLGSLTVSGHVLDDLSGLPIQGAMVGGYVTGRGACPLPSTTWQPDGAYEIHASFGSYDTDVFHVRTSAPGYSGAQQESSALSVHMGATVDLMMQPVVPKPTPTPTKSAYLHITVDLQGRPPAPHSAWVTLLRIALLQGDVTVWSGTRTCDALGSIQIEGLDQTTYAVRIKAANTLSSMTLSPLLAPGPNLMHMGPLRSGDVNDDGQIDIIDFSLFRMLFGSSDPRADLNNSGNVDILDFSLLRSNFGVRGPTRWEGNR